MEHAEQGLSKVGYAVMVRVVSGHVGRREAFHEFMPQRSYDVRYAVAVRVKIEINRNGDLDQYYPMGNFDNFYRFGYMVPYC